MPASAKSACTSSSVALNDRLPTYNFFTVVLLAPPIKAARTSRLKRQDLGPQAATSANGPPGLKRAPQQQAHLAASASRSQPFHPAEGAGRRGYRRQRLGAVAGIDVDVFDGEIAGPDAGGGAARVQIDADGDVFREHFLMNVALVEGMLTALAADGDTGD